MNLIIAAYLIFDLILIARKSPGIVVFIVIAIISGGIYVVVWIYNGIVENINESRRKKWQRADESLDISDLCKIVFITMLSSEDEQVLHAKLSEIGMSVEMRDMFISLCGVTLHFIVEEKIEDLETLKSKLLESHVPKEHVDALARTSLSIIDKIK